MFTAVKIKVMVGIAALALLCCSAAPEILTPHLTFALAIPQQDSAEKPTEEEKPAQAESGKQNSEEKPAQEKPAQGESGQAKPAPAPTSSKPADNSQSQPAENPTATAPQSPNTTPGPSQSGSPAQEANPAPPGSPAPTSENVPTNHNAPAPPKPSPTVTSKPQNGGTANSKRRVIREGGTGDANAMLAPSMTAAQASHQRENTTRLLNSADANLQKIGGRQLTPDKQAAVDQIRAYMQQAKDALSRGDLQRSHNLALKANLLSEDLARH